MKGINLGKWLIGGFFIFLGLGFLLDQFFSISFGLVFRYFWPVALMVCGLVVIIRAKSSFIWGLILFIIGGFILTGMFVNLPFTIWQLWPLVFVAIGLSVLFGGKQNRWGNWDPQNQSVDSKDKFESTAIFWGDSRKINSQNLKGGEITAIFGGCEIDLRDAKFAKEGAKIEISSIFGGVSLIVNNETLVKSDGVGIFGGFVDQTHKPEKPAQELWIKGAAIFGGVGIQNK